MVNTQNLSSAQLRRALQLKEEIENLEQELSQILGTPAISTGGLTMPGRRGRPLGSGRFLSAAARERIAAAQRARWAKHRSQSGDSSSASQSPARKNGRRMSAAARARIAEAARRRWAEYRAKKS